MWELNAAPHAAFENEGTQQPDGQAAEDDVRIANCTSQVTRHKSHVTRNT